MYYAILARITDDEDPMADPFGRTLGEVRKLIRIENSAMMAETMVRWSKLGRRILSIDVVSR